MEKTGKLRALLAMAVCCVLASSLLFAAEDNGRGPRGGQGGPGQGGPGGDRGGQRGPGGDRGQRGGFDRGAMEERMMNMIKERVGASDDEWTIIQPRLKEVMDLQQNSRSGGMRFMFGGRGRGGQETEAPSEPVEAASRELQQTLEKEAPTTAEIKAKLEALRGAREKNKQKLLTAQQKLKEVLTVKQEAMLVMMGMLE